MCSFFLMLGESEKLVPKIIPINKTYKSFDLDLNSYFFIAGLYYVKNKMISQ